MITRVKLFLTLIFASVGFLQHEAASAQVFPKVYVYGEADTPDHTACSASHSSAIAAVKAALRSNNVPLAVSEKEYSYLQAYVNISSIKLPNGCAVKFSLNFQNTQFIDEEYTNKKVFTTVLFCSKGAIYTGDPAYIYSSLLSLYKDMTNKCVSEYYDKISE